MRRQVSSVGFRSQVLSLLGTCVAVGRLRADTSAARAVTVPGLGGVPPGTPCSLRGPAHVPLPGFPLRGPGADTQPPPRPIFTLVPKPSPVCPGHAKDSGSGNLSTQKSQSHQRLQDAVSSGGDGGPPGMPSTLPVSKQAARRHKSSD